MWHYLTTPHKFVHNKSMKFTHSIKQKLMQYGYHWIAKLISEFGRKLNFNLPARSCDEMKNFSLSTQILFVTNCWGFTSSTQLINFGISKARPICSMHHAHVRSSNSSFQFLALLTPSFSPTHMHQNAGWFRVQLALIVKFWVFVISWPDDLLLWW